MAKGTKLSTFEKGKITALKKDRKSEREISKALGESKTVICNYLKSPEELLWSKKGNFVNIKNIEISSGCSLQY